MDNTTHTFKEMKVNERTFDVGVFVSYHWEEGLLDELEDFYPEVDDFSLTDIYERLPDGNQIAITWDDPVRFDILDAIDYRINEALVGVTKQNE